MRITQSMLSNNMLRHLMDSQQKLDKHLERLYTGRKINFPSDDPVIAMKGIAYRTEVSEIDQFKRNTGEVRTWMDNSDAALDKATQAMHRLYELSIQASNSTYEQDELNSIKEEVMQLEKHLVDIANTQVSGKYIFNGINTTEPPITFGNNNEINIDTRDGSIDIEVFKGTYVQANVDATELFDEDFFENISGFIEALEDPENSDFNEIIQGLDQNTSQILDSRASLGARMNRLDLIENRL